MRVVMLLVVTLLACTRAPPRFGEPGAQLSDGSAEESYRALLEKYTDRSEVYGGFDTRVFTQVTYQALPFREARVRRRASFQALPDVRVQALLAEERGQAAEFHEFFFGVHANEAAYNDFDRKKSIWRIALITPSGEITPAKVDRVGRATMDMRAYYPSLGDFWTGYRVRFPKQFPEGQAVIPDGTKEVMFRIASTLGQAEMTVGAQ